MRHPTPRAAGAMAICFVVLVAGVLGLSALTRPSGVPLPPSGPPASPAAPVDASPATLPEQGVLPPPSAATCPHRAIAAAARVRPGADVILRVPVLMYHVVAAPADHEPALPGLDVSPAEFGAQLDAVVAAGWHTMTLAALGRDVHAGDRPPPRSLVLTFDDGHEDGYTRVLPALRSRGMVATFFVITGRIGDQGYLTDTQLRTMACLGMEVADHTRDHVDLTRLAASAIDRQLRLAASAIAAIVGTTPTTVAYPFGREDAAVVARVAALGFALAVTTRPGVAESVGNALVVPRIRVSPAVTPARLMSMLAAYARG